MRNEPKEGKKRNERNKRKGRKENSGSEQNRNKRKLILSWGTVLVWMIVIFLFSADNAVDSGKKSGFLLGILRRIFINEQEPARLEYYAFLIRKIAHFSEYFVFGILVLNAWIQTVVLKEKKRWKVFAGSLICCVFYAMTDEFHQYFVPGRFASPKDVLIDSLGALTGIVLFSGILLHKERKRIKSSFE